MTIRSIKWAAGVSLFAAVLAVGTTLPERQASAQVQAVPRAGVSFNDTVTVRATIESVDPESRTVAFTLPDGRLLSLAGRRRRRQPRRRPGRCPGRRHLQRGRDPAEPAPEGPGLEGSAQQMNVKPNKTDIEAGRFTLTVTAVDLANNTVSVIDGRGGPVRTYSAKLDRQAGHAEEDQGRRRGDRAHDAAARIAGDHARQVRARAQEAYLISTSSQKPIQWSTGFILGCGASYDHAARGLRAALDDVVELHAVRAFEIARRLGRDLQQVHPHRVARKIDVAADLEGAVAAGDHLAVPCRRVGHRSRSLEKVRH